MTTLRDWPADWLVPEWPVPARVRACVTTRSTGNSTGPYAQFNLGEHVGEALATVQANRVELAAQLGCTPVWLEQVHGVTVVEAAPEQGRLAEADASFTCTAGLACAILTADCLPVLLADTQGRCVAAAHAGWRGLVAGVLENTVAALPVEPGELVAWLGPAIGAQVYEVGPEVRYAFMQQQPEAAMAFVPSSRPDHWLADLYQLARLRLAACGVTAVYGGGLCTLTDTRFYSYRQSPQTGRFASLIWLD